MKFATWSRSLSHVSMRVCFSNQCFTRKVSSLRSMNAWARKPDICSSEVQILLIRTKNCCSHGWGTDPYKVPIPWFTILLCNDRQAHSAVKHSLWCISRLLKILLPLYPWRINMLSQHTELLSTFEFLRSNSHAKTLFLNLLLPSLRALIFSWLWSRRSG